MSEVETTNVEVVNQAFLDKLDSGMVKEAQEAASAYVRQKIYEEGFLRRLFEPRPITADELDPNIDDDKPRIIVEKEPDATTATFVPFKGTGDRNYFTGKRFSVPFGKVESERLSKSKFELMTIRMDIMSWLKDNQVKAVHQEEDQFFMDTVADILTINTGQDVAAGDSDSFKTAFTTGLQTMSGMRLPVGKVLMNKNTYYSSLSLKTDEIGYKPQEQRFENGVEDETSFLGYPVVTTIKDDLVSDNEMYFFAPMDYFCKFYLLQDATLFLKYEADMINFHTYEAPGFGIGNTKGVVRITL